MNTPPIPDEPTDALALARDAAEHAAGRQLSRRDPAHEQFYAYGSALSGCLTALGELTDTLSRQVAGYGHARLLRDDAGADPADE